MLLAGPSNPLGQRPDIGEDGVDKAGFCSIVGFEVEGDALNQGSSDDRGVGGARYLGGLFRGSDPETDRDRQSSEPAQPRDRAATSA